MFFLLSSRGQWLPSYVDAAIKLQVEEEVGGGAGCLKVAGSNNIHLKDIGLSPRAKDKA